LALLLYPFGAEWECRNKGGLTCHDSKVRQALRRIHDAHVAVPVDAAAKQSQGSSQGENSAQTTSL